MQLKTTKLHWKPWIVMMPALSSLVTTKLASWQLSVLVAAYRIPALDCIVASLGLLSWRRLTDTLPSSHQTRPNSHWSRHRWYPPHSHHWHSGNDPLDTLQKEKSCKIYRSKYQRRIPPYSNYYGYHFGTIWWLLIMYTFIGKWVTTSYEMNTRKPRYGSILAHGRSEQ